MIIYRSKIINMLIDKESLYRQWKVVPYRFVYSALFLLLLQILHKEYNTACQPAWLFIQKFIYGISTQWDTASPNACALASSLGLQCLVIVRCALVSHLRLQFCRSLQLHLCVSNIQCKSAIYVLFCSVSNKVISIFYIVHAIK